MMMETGEQTWGLNPFFRVRLDETPQCDLFLLRKTVELPDARYLTLLGRISSHEGGLGKDRVAAEAGEVLGVSDAQAQAITDDLIEHQLLVDGARRFEALSGAQHWVRRDWADGLMLHLSSRDTAFDPAEREDRNGFLDREVRKNLAQQELPSLYKDVDGPRHPLPEPDPEVLSKPLQDTLLRRRSNRRYQVGHINQPRLAAILEAANRETLAVRRRVERRLAEQPHVLLDSAFTALETYVVVYDVEGVAPGLYHYDLRDHSLVQMRTGDFRADVRAMAIGQESASSGAFTLLITAVWDRYIFRYRHPRAYRNLMINVAELAQKYLLLITACDLNMFLTPNFENCRVDALLQTDGYVEAGLYLIGAG